jgi:hypothetical protein
VRVRPAVEWFAPGFVPGPGCGLYARFYQAEPAPVVGTTKCPESLCLMLALPPSGRRVPSPPRTLLLGLRSYRLMRQSRVALLSFGFWASFVESSQVATSPCCYRDYPDVISANPSSDAWSRTPAGPTECIYLFLPLCHRPSPCRNWVGFPLFFREHDFSRTCFPRLQTFLYVQASEFACLPDRSHRCAHRTGQPRLLRSG